MMERLRIKSLASGEELLTLKMEQIKVIQTKAIRWWWPCGGILIDVVLERLNVVMAAGEQNPIDAMTFRQIKALHQTLKDMEGVGARMDLYWTTLILVVCWVEGLGPRQQKSFLWCLLGSHRGHGGAGKIDRKEWAKKAYTLLVK
jgi:hypothetical protein